jgi:hypothetical protein
MTERADVSETEEWARSVWRMLVEGGTWGVPRTGLMFQKRDDKLCLVGRMPHEPALPITAEELRERQDFDIDGVTRMFAQIGIEVVGDE